VEAQNFERANIYWEYDDVMNKQRRDHLRVAADSFLEGRDQKDYSGARRSDCLNRNWLKRTVPRAQHPDQWNINTGVHKQTRVLNQFGFDPKAAGRSGLSAYAESRHARGTNDSKGESTMTKKRKFFFSPQTLPLAGTPHIASTWGTGSWKDHLA